MPTTNLNELAYTVRNASMLLVRRVRYYTELLPPHHFSTLAWLQSGCVATAAEIAERERVSAPSMSRTVAELCEKGYLERRTDPDDRRRQLLALTPAGDRALADAREQRNHWMAERLATLTDDERATLRRAAEIITTMLEDR